MKYIYLLVCTAALTMAALAKAEEPTLIPSVGLVAASATGGPVACPPYIIIGVYKPVGAAKDYGCYYKSGVRGAITVTFYKDQNLVPLKPGQAVRYAPKSGYYAFPP